jgi:hypothetical protein
MPAQSRTLICTRYFAYLSGASLSAAAQSCSATRSILRCASFCFVDEVARAPHRLLINRAPATPFVVLRDMLVTPNLRGQLPMS